jgi:hypothetical protein
VKHILEKLQLLTGIFQEKFRPITAKAGGNHQTKEITLEGVKRTLLL